MRSSARGLIVLDNTSHVFGGDENSKREVAAFVNLLNGLSEEIDGVVLLLGHPVVPPTAFLIEYRDGTRGTILLLNGHHRDFVFAAKIARQNVGLWRDGIRRRGGFPARRLRFRRHDYAPCSEHQRRRRDRSS